MNRAGILSIVLAAAVTGACGGADGASSSPTGPSSTTPTTSSQPAPQGSCVPGNLTASVSGSAVTLRWSAVNGATEYSVLVGSTPTSSTPAFKPSAEASLAGRRTKPSSPSADRRWIDKVLAGPANPLDGPDRPIWGQTRG